MYSTRFLQLVVLTLSILCVTEASWRDSGRFKARDLLPTVDVGSDGDSSGGSDGTEASATPTTPPDTTSKVQDQTSSSAAPDTSSSAQETSSKPQDTPTPTPTPSTTPPVTSSTPSPKSSTKVAETTKASTTKDSKQKTTNTPVVSTFYEVVTRTGSNGDKQTMTTAVKTTSTPGLNKDGDKGSSGMSTKTRNTIIGVVVGVGGAIVLGALGLVAWRIWGRKRHADENDGLMAYDGGYTGIKEPEPGSSAGPTTAPTHQSPFQSTLENYHQPAPVNASSNF